jgi:hypothetical protein
MIFVGIIVFLFAFALSLYGFGRVTRTRLKLPAGSWPMTMAIGLAGWIVLGGVLNLLRISYSRHDLSLPCGGLYFRSQISYCREWGIRTAVRIPPAAYL